LRATALRVAPGGAVAAEVLERVHRRDHVRLLVRIGDEDYEAVAPVVDPPSPGDRVRLAVDHDGVAIIG
ncbi:TOBE domain-containing protein, partial [Actinosynnema sp. NPDC023658]|uniref:TOBE domain-containing protein n=1 Tax=Actinosynnema sp. NPDC023658 TaxID=3155465 RepID=UPI0033E595D0